MPSRVVRVLLVEDNAADAEATSDALAFSRTPRCTVTHVGRLADAHARLARERFDVVLLDLGLPDARGLDGVHTLRAAAPETAIVVLSGLGSEAVALDALTTGAQDYLVKGQAGDDALKRSIRFAIARREADVAQRRLAAIVESTDDAVITIDLEARVATWNAGAERLLGYAAEEIIGKPVALLVPPDGAAEQREILARVRAGERLHGIETQRVHRDGSRVDVSLAVSAIRDAQGSVIAIAAIARDITAKARAAASLRAAQEQFRLAFEEAPIGMALLSLDRRFMRVNRAFCAITGYTAAELEGSPTTFVTHPDDPAADEADVLALLEGRTSQHSADRRIRHAEGHVVWVALSITCVRGDDGRPQHFLTQMIDVTDRRRYEERLQHMADHDPLTGLLNRRAFARELRDHVARSARYGAAGAALMIDLDAFKSYNDTLGHQAGDELIAQVADSLAARLRRSDVLARLGGDEFAVILPTADESAAARVAAELLDCIRGDGAPGPDGRRVAITASIGVAFFDDSDESAPEQVMVEADRAMYEAKQRGRDRVAFAARRAPSAAGS
jgi:diguanylate cyclase (GGDEF)-like protein/PAS domain S-box-containing protein